jgi:tetratricopeptide (TPR) repeat protein
MAAGEYYKATLAAPVALEMIEKEGREHDQFNMGANVYWILLAAYGHALGCVGEFRKGQRLLGDALRHAEGVDDRYAVAFAEFMYGFDCDSIGDGPSAVQHLERCVKLAEETNFFTVLGQAYAALAWGSYLADRLEAASEFATRAVDIQRDTGVPYNICVPYWVLSMVHLDSGALEASQDSAERALELARDSGQVDFQGLSWLMLGRILARRDPSRGGEAEKNIRRGIAMLEEARLRPFVWQGHLYLGELYADSGQKDKALRTLKKAEAEFTDMGMDYWLSRAQTTRAKLES